MKTGLWFAIEEGAQLELSIVGQSRNNPQLVGGARYVPDRGEEEMWKAIPGPYKHTFDENSGNATVRIGVRFLTEQSRTATVSATVTKSSGEVLKESSGADTFQLQLSGKKGDGIKRGTLVLVRKT